MVTSVAVQTHDISVAILVSFLFPGAGQFYNGQVGKALTLLIPSLVGMAVLVMQVYNFRVALPLGAAEFLVWLFGIIEAALIAARLKRGEKVRLWKWF